MHVRELRMKLDSLESTLSTWGAKSGDIADLKRLSEALVPFDELTVAALCSQLGAIASGTANSPRPRPAPKAGPNHALVSRYVAALAAETLDHATMQAALTELRSDKHAKVPELTAIASLLSGVEGKYKNKAVALEKIEAVVRRRLDTGRRLEGTSGIF